MVNSSPFNSSQASMEHSHTSRKIFYLHSGQVVPRNSAQHGRRNYGKQAYNKLETVSIAELLQNRQHAQNP